MCERVWILRCGRSLRGLLWERQYSERCLRDRVISTACPCWCLLRDLRLGWRIRGKWYSNDICYTGFLRIEGAWRWLFGRGAGCWRWRECGVYLSLSLSGWLIAFTWPNTIPLSAHLLLLCNRKPSSTHDQSSLFHSILVVLYALRFMLRWPLMHPIPPSHYTKPLPLLFANPPVLVHNLYVLFINALIHYYQRCQHLVLRSWLRQLIWGHLPRMDFKFWNMPTLLGKIYPVHTLKELRQSMLVGVTSR